MKMKNLVDGIVQELQSSSKRTDKEEVLRGVASNRNVEHNEMFLQWIQLCHNSDKFHLKSENLESFIAKNPKPKQKSKDLFSTVFKKSASNPFMEMFKILMLMFKGGLSGHDAKIELRDFLADNPKMKPYLFGCLNKKSNTGLSAKTINKIIPNFITIFQTALGYKYDPKRVELDKCDWYLSRKLDGVRCVMILDLDNDVVESYSRTGNKFGTVGKVEEQALTHFKKKGLTGCYVLDGEITLDTSIKSDDFSGIMKQISKKNHTIKNPMYWLFDFLTLQEFESLTSTTTFMDRILQLRSLMPRIDFKGGILNTLRIVKQIKVKSLKQISDESDAAKANGREGVMVRKDTTYSGKRSHDILKVKQFFDDEFKVLDVTFTKKGMLNSDTGLVDDIDCIKALIIEHKGNQVDVGSGLSDNERVEWYNNPSLIIGKEITVQYFEETQNKDGNYSLRFPTLKIVHGKNGRNT